MSYFNFFPYTDYKLEGQPAGVVVKDILRRSKFFNSVQDSLGLYRTYTVQDGERPEQVANKFYGNVNYFWIVMLFNEIHDPFFEWAMSDNDVVEYCTRVYGVPTMYQVRHYERDGLVIGEVREFDKEDPDFAWVPPINPGPQDPTVYPVSHLEYEQRLNDARREIKILREDIIPSVITEFEASING